jgi:hypothetical protein
MTYIALRLVRNRISNAGQIDQECKTIYVPVPSYEAEVPLALGNGEWKIDQAELVNYDWGFGTGWNCPRPGVNLVTLNREHDERMSVI